MRLIHNLSTNPYFNMAADEYLLKNSQEEIFMLWQNAPCVVIGKNQNALAEIDMGFLDQENMKLVRRSTGGGAVYHDFGNLNYSVFVNNEDKNYDFSAFSRTVIDTLAGLGLTAEYSGRNDLLLNGSKISGCAQLVHQGRLLHHGTLLIDSDLSIMSKVLKPAKEKYTGNAVKSVMSRVCNINDHLPIPVTVDEIINRLFQFADGDKENVPGTFTRSELAQIRALEQKKYVSWEWNYGDFPHYDYANQAKFLAGLVGISFSTRQGIIERIKIHGDFIGNREIIGLEQCLQGKKHEKQSLLDVLRAVNLEEYIQHITAADIMELLF